MKVNIKNHGKRMLTAVAQVSLSGFSIPKGHSKCFPVQHLANVLAGVFLWSVVREMAFWYIIYQESTWDRQSAGYFRAWWALLSSHGF